MLARPRTSSRAPQLDEQPDVKGLRDYALLMIWLHTGRNRLEIAGLRWQNIQISGDDVTVVWRSRHASSAAQLPVAASEALLRYLLALHGPSLDKLAPDTPIWVRLRANKGEMLSIEMIDSVYREYRRSQLHATV